MLSHMANPTKRKATVQGIISLVAIGIMMHFKSIWPVKPRFAPHPICDALALILGTLENQFAERPHILPCQMVVALHIDPAIA